MIGIQKDCNRTIARFIFAASLVAAFLFFSKSAEAAFFTAYPSNPVFSYSNVSGTFDQSQVRGASVVYVNGVYRMYYTGLGTTNSLNIGLATSSDGVTWHRYSSQPVFRCGDNKLSSCGNNLNWSSWSVYYPTVIYENGIYKMWYGGDFVNGPSVDQVGYATSTDGIHWNSYDLNPIFPENRLGNLVNNGFVFRGIAELNHVYFMYYRKTVNSNTQTYVATSSDGINWNEANNNQPVLSSDSNYLGTMNGLIYLEYRNNLFLSSDGVTFLPVSSDVLTNDVLGNGTFLAHGDLVRMWRSRFVGNVTWSGGNYAINYYTAPLATFPTSATGGQPLHFAVPDQTVAEGQQLAFHATATDPLGHTLLYSATGLPTGAVYSSSTGLFSWTPGYHAAGTYDITFWAKDTANASRTASTTIVLTVTNTNTPPVISSIGNQTVIAGNVLQFNVTATDTDSDVIALRMQSGPPGAVFATTTGVFSWTPAVNQAGVYSALFEATDNGIPSATSSMNVTITVTAPSVGSLITTLRHDIANSTLPRWIKRTYTTALRLFQRFSALIPGRAAVAQLNRFMRQVQRDVVRGRVASTTGANLITTANVLKQAIASTTISTPKVRPVPLITQIKSPYPPESASWADELYDNGLANNNGHCRTIAQCACAITSMTMLGQYYGITTGYDGSVVNPGNMNAWLETHNGYDGLGYIRWWYSLQYLSHTYGYSTIQMDRFALSSTSQSTFTQTDNYLVHNEPAVAHSRKLGHYFVLTKALGNNVYATRDPYWYNTTSTNDVRNIADHVQGYAGILDSVNLYSHTTTSRPFPRWVEIHLHSPAELLLTDSQGRQTGYDPATGQVVNQIPNSSYDQKANVIDPSSTSTNTGEDAPKVLIVTAPQDDVYTLSVIGTGDGPYHLSIDTGGGYGDSQINDTTGTTTPGQVNTYVVGVPVRTSMNPAIDQLRSLATSKEQSQPTVAIQLNAVADQLTTHNFATTTATTTVTLSLSDHNSDHDQDRGLGQSDQSNVSWWSHLWPWSVLVQTWHGVAYEQSQLDDRSGHR